GQGPVPLVGLDPVSAPDLPGPEHTSPGSAAAHGLPVIFHRDAVEARFTKGDWSIPGSATAWMRLSVPFIAGEETPALCELLAVADFGSALSQSVAPEAGVALINVDVNVTLAGSPVGPWFCLATQGSVSDEGIGLAVTHLFDLNGPLGAITQSQIVYGFSRS
ncbi:MAG: hypothetical protein WC005_09440, partial [Candidatus Nanopelagicales bacterium]